MSKKKSNKWTIETVSDEFLVRHAVKKDDLIGSNIEMMKRLKNSVKSTNKSIQILNKSIKTFNRSSSWWALTLVFLTLVMLIAVGFQLYLASS